MPIVSNRMHLKIYEGRFYFKCSYHIKKKKKYFHGKDHHEAKEFRNKKFKKEHFTHFSSYLCIKDYKFYGKNILPILIKA